MRAALRTARATKQPAIHDNVAMRIDGMARAVTVIVLPVANESDPELCVVAFRDAGALNEAEAGEPAESGNADVQAL